MSNDNEVLVRVEGVSKKFCRDLKKSLWYGLKDVASELLPIQNSKSKIQSSNDELRPGEFWANKDISFELRRGECLGLIGHNGAGKTTLLKMLNGLIKPDAGKITIRGRIGSIIALGAGFNPILTGRENVYVYGSVLGLAKLEIDQKIDEIIDFAELRDFIDSPVQSYSSGMTVRLGFAIATSFKPDVLILDEVLAVGDFTFRKKCYERISEMQKSAAIIFVSHQIESLKRICTHGMLMKRGLSIEQGDFEAVAAIYEAGINEDNVQDSQDYYSSRIESVDLKLSSDTIPFRGQLDFAFECRSNVPLDNPQIRIAFLTAQDEIAGEWSSSNYPEMVSVVSSTFVTASIGIPNIPFKPGSYKITFMLTGAANSYYLVVLKRGLMLNITGTKSFVHHVQL
jgi:lipopolysaccharide transport system ATP-binding protein